MKKVFELTDALHLKGALLRLRTTTSPAKRGRRSDAAAELRARVDFGDFHSRPCGLSPAASTLLTFTSNPAQPQRPP